MLNSYNFFFHFHHRKLQEQIREKEEGGTRGNFAEKQEFKDLAKTIAKKWKNATDDEKAYFQRLADRDKIRHEREMTEWKREIAKEREEFRRMSAAANIRYHSNGSSLTYQGMAQMFEKKPSFQDQGSHTRASIARDDPLDAFLDRSMSTFPSPPRPVFHEQGSHTRDDPVEAFLDPSIQTSSAGAFPSFPSPPWPHNHNQGVAGFFALPPRHRHSRDALTDQARIRLLADRLGDDGVDAVIRLFGDRRSS